MGSYLYFHVVPNRTGKKERKKERDKEICGAGSIASKDWDSI